MVDIIVEPHRKQLIPFFDEVKQTAIENGALGAGISGSGPTIFALCKGNEIANKVEQAIKETYSKTNIEFNIYNSKINNQGVSIVESL